MYGTKYDVKHTSPLLETPEESWQTASRRRREVWLGSRRFSRHWAAMKYHELPLYVQQKWIDEHHE